MNNVNGLTVSVVFKSGAVNRDEKIGGSIASIKKLTREGRSYSFLSRPFLRHQLFQHLRYKGWIESPVEPQKEVIQFRFPYANIVTHAEMDYFGYMMTNPFTITRKHTLGMTKAIALNEWGGNMAFYANHNMVRRASEAGFNADPNPYSREEDDNYYLVTYTFDLPRMGYEEVKISISSKKSSSETGEEEDMADKQQKRKAKKESKENPVDFLYQWMRPLTEERPVKVDEIKRRIKRPYIAQKEEIEKLKWYELTPEKDRNGTVPGYVGFEFSLDDVKDMSKLEKELKKSSGIKVVFAVTDGEYINRLRNVLEAIDSGYMLDASGECYSSTPVFAIAAALQVPVPLFDSAIAVDKGLVRANDLNSLIGKSLVEKVWCEERAMRLDGELEKREKDWNVEEMVKIACGWSQ